MRPHRRQPTRLPCPWDSPGKNTGVGCHFLLQCMKVKSENEVAQSCPNLSDPMDCSLPGSSIHAIFQARVLFYPEHWLLVMPHLVHFHRQVIPSTLLHGALLICLADITGTVYIPVLTKINFTLIRIWWHMSKRQQNCYSKCFCAAEHLMFSSKTDQVIL